MSMYLESIRAFMKPVLQYLDDAGISEIMINGPQDVWIERKGRLTKTDAVFTEEALLGAARNIAQYVGRMLTDERPRLDARLPDGSRIHIVIPPIARKGTTISIRKFFKDKLTPQSLVQFGSFTPQMLRTIEAAVRIKLNMVVSGGTGSGKTTLLNVLSSLIPGDERILTIEDAAELQLSQDHLVPFESRPADKFGKGEVNMGHLLQSALRLRPDRIVVGEVRGAEAFDLMQAMNTGHGGSFATVHANTPTDTLRRLESLCLMAPIELPMVAVRAQVAAAINFIVCCERFQDGSRKTHAVADVLPLDSKGEYRTADLWVFIPVTKDSDGNILGYHAPTGILPTWLSRARAYGFTDLDEAYFDPATYGIPPPPLVHGLGEEVHTQWAPSLKHREKGKPDPDEFAENWRLFEKKLKDEGEAKLQAKKKAAVAEAPKGQAQVQVPAAPAPAAKPAEAAKPAPAAPESKPAPPAAAPKAAPAAKPAPARAASDDATPPPTRNPLLAKRAPAAEEEGAAGVEVSESLDGEGGEAPPADEGATSIRPNPLTQPRPGQATTAPGKGQGKPPPRRS